MIMEKQSGRFYSRISTISEFSQILESGITAIERTFYPAALIVQSLVQLIYMNLIKITMLSKAI
ncbi:hypothetical protein D3C76_123020 [compost metagenome]